MRLGAGICMPPPNRRDVFRAGERAMNDGDAIRPSLPIVALNVLLSRWCVILPEAGIVAVNAGRLYFTPDEDKPVALTFEDTDEGVKFKLRQVAPDSRILPACSLATEGIG